MTSLGRAPPCLCLVTLAEVLLSLLNSQLVCHGASLGHDDGRQRRLLNEAMAFHSKSGCPMCGIVARGISTAPNSPLFSPLSSSFASASSPPPPPRRPGSNTRLGGAQGQIADGPEILYRDDNFTIYRERAYPVSSRVHLVIVFKYVLFFVSERYYVSNL